MPYDWRLARRIDADLLQPVDRGLALAGGFEDHGGHVGAGSGLVTGHALAHFIENRAQNRGAFRRWPSLVRAPRADVRGVRAAAWLDQPAAAAEEPALQRLSHP